MLFIILSLLFTFIGTIGFILISNHITYSDVFAVVCCTLFYVSAVITLSYAIDRDKNPTAIDVYRGKTTLEVTYKDGVAIDSTVVFKSKK